MPRISAAQKKKDLEELMEGVGEEKFGALMATAKGGYGSAAKKVRDSEPTQHQQYMSLLSEMSRDDLLTPGERFIDLQVFMAVYPFEELQEVYKKRKKRGFEGEPSIDDKIREKLGRMSL